jgi:hypothetical protein
MSVDTERAWAAGFFDGEGSTCCKENGRAISMSIQQLDRAVLDRFAAAVDGQAKVYGPYVRRGGCTYYQLQADGPARVKHISETLPWLGVVKRGQAMHAIAAFEGSRRDAVIT